MQGAVPGDVLTDLQNAGLIGDPLYELNFQNATLWNGYSWTYATSFTMTPGQLAAARAGAVSHMLVFDGIKMGANIHVNGKLVGQAADQFLRYAFDIEASLLKAGAGANTIEVTFENEIDCGGRWMSCTGGWDWAPYTTTSQGGAATFSKGIWKSVYIAEVASAAITHIVPQIFYKGAYPVVPLTEGDHGGFDVEVRVHMWAASATSGTLTATGEWGGSASQLVQVPAGHSHVVLKTTASAAQIKLWWPAGHGAQPLYNLTVAFTATGAPQADANPISGTRQVGFRFFALVTGDDTDPDYVKKNADGDGTSANGMFWRINGAAILSKGANMIPMEELEGRMSANAHVQLVQNAVDGGMNTLRVWGGGMFLPDAFYDTCDALGIMIYHDMQYAQQGHSPANTTNQDAELRHQVRRLSHHPSIVMWDGCNECHVVMGTKTGIYATFVMTVVAQEDMSRVVWPSCPASGWTTGVNTLTSLPNGKALTTPVGGPHFETHGPYQHGGGFPAVNGNAGSALFSSNIPIKVSTGVTGLNESNVFASEFGCSVYSSFESMSPTLKEEHWGIQGGSPPDDCHGGFSSHCEGDNAMAQRNYPCNNIISVYFGGDNFNATGELVFKKQLWQCMVGQALVIKQNIETRRARNQFGIIVWQFNEIWPTGGWGSIEYGTVGYTKGQVLGGRWKPLQYWYRKTIYTDVMVACGDAGQDDTSQVCYVNNDSPFPFTGTVQIDAVDFATGTATSVASKKLALPAGAGVTEFFTIDASNFDGAKAILHGVVRSGAGEVVNDNWMPMVEPKKMTLPKASVSFAVADTANPDGTVDVTVTTDKFALYVTLTTLAQGRFSDNAFCLAGGSLKLQFIPVQGFELAELKSSLRVEHAAAYMNM
jgi:beta-galactosidase/beta-glucuronidase